MVHAHTHTLIWLLSVLGLQLDHHDVQPHESHQIRIAPPAGYDGIDDEYHEHGDVQAGVHGQSSECC